MEIGPERIVDQKKPQEHFRELVEGKRPPRVFLVRDERAGCGKSLLLRRLAANCLGFAGSPPAARVDLADVSDPSPFHLVTRLSEQLGDDRLPGFVRLRNAVGVDPMPFRAGSDVAPYFHGEVNADQQQVAAGGVSAGIHMNQVNIQLPTWSETMRPGAERMCLQAFVEDLRALGPERPAVILVDSVDEKAAEPKLREWVVEWLLQGVFLNPQRRPPHVVLVVAGRQLPDYGALLGANATDRLVEPPFQADWEPSHTEAFLRLVVGESPQADLVEFFHGRIVNQRTSVGAVGQSVRLLLDR